MYCIWVTDSVVGHDFCVFVFIARSFNSKLAMLLVPFDRNGEVEHAPFQLPEVLTECVEPLDHVNLR